MYVTFISPTEKLFSKTSVEFWLLEIKTIVANE